MANPLPNEAELYKKIEDERLTIPKPIWDLLCHHIGNDLYAISLITSSYVTGEDKEPIPVEAGEKILNHVYALKSLMLKLYEITVPKKKTV